MRKPKFVPLSLSDQFSYNEGLHDGEERLARAVVKWVQKEWFNGEDCIEDLKNWLSARRKRKGR